MKIYFEGAGYKSHQIDERVKSLFISSPKTEDFQTLYVGYFSDHKKQPIVFLPKIALELIEKSEDSLAELATTGLAEASSTIHSISYEFLSKFVYIFYLSLVKFCKRNQETILSMSGRLFEINLKSSSFNTTELEIVIGLLDFYKKHRDLIRFASKQQSSSSNLAIDWGTTVRSVSPVVSGKNIVYMEMISNVEEQNYVDELLTVFHSLLLFLSKTYGIKVKASEFYKKISFRNVLRFNTKCKAILKRIRGKHFDDRYIKLHRLLTAYFEIHSSDTKNKHKEDRLLVRDYNIVFEDMVDLLLSDQKVISELKNQRDGKIVDHLYKYESLFDGEEIYYIGDSKYYKDSTSFSTLAKYKQFTYAKNVIHFNVDPFSEKEQLSYRDDITEGYNLSPSFFVNGFINDENLSNPSHGFERDSNNLKESFICQFENRLFDRDSLYLCYFKMNFLFILKSYVTENRLKLIKLRDEVYKCIRSHFISLYNSNYNFYKLHPTIAAEEFINLHFRYLHGKVYQCNQDKVDGTITLGLQIGEDYVKENEDLLNEITKKCSYCEYEFS